jgi:hypothetical protein
MTFEPNDLDTLQDGFETEMVEHALTIDAIIVRALQVNGVETLTFLIDELDAKADEARELIEPDDEDYDEGFADGIKAAANRVRAILDDYSMAIAA